ncbi:hypothetical protein BGW36DRAFT_425771 [Talaromyces proteolyticus]|uniref:Uncharacterized protein n=1 Tax=Talaromyces proteolyticus TaxID=1131652 RepID=A0AAD4Q322_9EURO|nr:uncharacterized protein BGW36DRAFT_425771 [Talaromyces proteolyticus]KAH8700971.1 hypothetical protein BGW36DRAFT_425771 [Talaromyces proteolyticus]
MEIREKENIAGITLQCNQCTRRYSTQSALLRHKKSHDRNAWYSCEVCHLKFSRKDILQRHKQVHGNTEKLSERKRAIHACDECRKNKIRCNSDYPCQSCIKSGKQCTYLTQVSRPSIQGFRGRRKNVTHEARLPSESIDADSPQNQQPSRSQSDASNIFLPIVPHGDTFTSLSSSNQLLLTDIDLLLSQSQTNRSLTARHAVNFPAVSELVPSCTTRSSFNGPLHLTDSIGYPSLKQTDPSTFSVLQTLGPANNWFQELALPMAISHNVVRDMVQQAAADFVELEIKDAVWRSRKRRSFSHVILDNFNLSAWMKGKKTHLLHTFVTSFFDNFSPLWPISWRQGFDHDAVEPLLYLTMTAIGAMYAGCPSAASYGLILHQELCAVLPDCCLLCADIETKLEAIFEALLLSEIMSLYRGDSQASTYVKHASAILVAHARRIGVFLELPAQQFKDSTLEICHDQTEKKLQQWIRMERRRRMAFGFLRCEVFSSIIFNTRPIIAAEDLRLRAPCDHGVWMYVGPEWRDKLLSVVEKVVCYPLYSDLMCTITKWDRSQIPLLDPYTHELVLYGLQISLLTSCHNSSKLFSNFQNSDQLSTNDPSVVITDWQTPIEDLTLSKILRHIDEWKTVQDKFQAAGHNGTDKLRNPSAQLLYHMGYIRSNADLVVLQEILSYDNNSPLRTESQERAFRKVCWWATTDAAKVALLHACHVWAVAEKYLMMQSHLANSSLRYDQGIDIFSVISLCYAAIVIWVMAELCPNIDIQVGHPDNNDADFLVVNSGNIRQGIEKISDVVTRASPPSWQTASFLVMSTKALTHKALYLF